MICSTRGGSTLVVVLILSLLQGSGKLRSTGIIMSETKRTAFTLLHHHSFVVVLVLRCQATVSPPACWTSSSDNIISLRACQYRDSQRFRAQVNRERWGSIDAKYRRNDNDAAQHIHSTRYCSSYRQFLGPYAASRVCAGIRLVFRLLIDRIIAPRAPDDVRRLRRDLMTSSIFPLHLQSHPAMSCLCEQNAI